MRSFQHIILLAIFVNLLGLNLPAQSDSLKIDSMKKVIQAQQEDTNKVNTLNELSDKFTAINDFSNSVVYAKQALSLSEKINFTTGKAKSSYRIGYIYTYTAESNNNDGLEYFLTALSLWDETHNKLDIAKTHYDIANIYGYRGNYTEAIKNLYAALPLFSQLNERKRMASCVFYIGMCYSSQGDHDEALKNVQKALNIYRELKDNEWIAFCYNTIGTENLALEKYSEALQMQLAAIKMYEKLGNSVQNTGLPLCYAGIANIYEKEGDLLYQKGDQSASEAKYKDALKNYLSSLKMYSDIKKIDGIAGVSAGIGVLYTKLKNFPAAKQYLESSLKLSRNANIKESVKESYAGLAGLDSAQQNFKSAYGNYKMYVLYRDSLLNQETSKKLLQSKMQYDFDRKEASTRAAQEKKDAETKRLRNIQYSVMAFFILIAAFLYWNNRQKQKAKTKIETAYSELRSTQAQLIQSEKMASLGELTAGIAHEIQNPLNFVNNFSEVNKEMIAELKDEIDKGNYDEVKMIANDIEANEAKINLHGKRADGIVKGMLQHSRHTDGKKELTDINKLADEYLRLAYHGLRAKDKSFNATMETNYAPSIGAVNIVPQDIGRVLLNLINNAFYAVNEKKKMDIEGYEPTVSIVTKRNNDKVDIRVTDNGNGIPQKIVDKIFQPFFTTKPTGQGTGLGLSLAYDIVKAHGGELKVKTKEGDGSEFIIQLPSHTITR